MKNLSVNEVIHEFEYDYFMYVPLSIILQSCIGSVAAMLILANGTTLLTGIQLSLCVSLCMGYNAALLVQAKIKPIFWLLMASLLINTILISINAFI